MESMARKKLRPRRAFTPEFKAEIVELCQRGDRQAWSTKAAARRAIVGYIAWYNGTRLYSILGYRSPAESEEVGKIKKGKIKKVA